MLVDFDQWISEEFGRGPFTALILVLEIGERTVEAVASTYLHVLGNEIDWPTMKGLLSGAPHRWNAAAVFASRDETGGPVPDRLAKLRLADTEERVRADRLELNRGAFFNSDGRRMTVEEEDATRH